jgi:cation transport ATPase
MSAAEAELSAVERERNREAWNLPRPPLATTERDASPGSAAAAALAVERRHETYAEDRKAGFERRRLVGFSVLIPLWVLSIVPIARESMDGRDGANAVLVYLAVGAISLGVAAAIRGLYVLLTKRRFWSPWVFLLAAVVAIVSYSVQTAGEEVPPVTAQTQESSAA